MVFDWQLPTLPCAFWAGDSPATLATEDVLDFILVQTAAAIRIPRLALKTIDPVLAERAMGVRSSKTRPVL